MMKKTIYAIILCLLSITICYASTNTYERTEDNLRVNKKWEIDYYNINDVLETPSVDASEKVYDFANILTDEEEKEVKELIDKFIKHTGFDLVFVSDSFTYSYDGKNEDYASNFYDYNDFGIDDEYYSGIVLFRNANSIDPYYSSYYFGETQLYYSEKIYNEILDDIYNDFSTGNYLSGIKKFIKESTKYYDKGPAPGSENYYVDENGYLHYREGANQVRPKYHPPIIQGFIISFAATAIVIAVLVKKNFMIAQETKAQEYLNKESISYTVKDDKLISSHTSSYVRSSSSGGGGSFGGGGGFHSSGGSSGGGHSGGGRHG